MRRIEFTRPARTSTGRARNAGEAAQQLAHVTRERIRIRQERTALGGRIQKIDARLEALTALEDKLLPMMRQEADRAKTALPPQQSVSPAPPLPAVPPLSAPAVRPPTALPVGMSEVTLQY
jgi:hypothetical protein